MHDQALAQSAKVLRVSGSKPPSLVDDLLAVELPLEIRIGHGPARDRQQHSIAVTMRTPGHDLDLALGFLFTEGIVRSADEITHIEHCRQVSSPESLGHVVRAELRDGLEVDLVRLQRNFYTTSSCGVCGKSSIEAVEAQGCQPVLEAKTKWPASVLNRIPSLVEQAQVLFRNTGGNHAAALVGLDEQLRIVREDVGRHNAVDKVVGAMLGSPWQDKHDNMLFLSGRAGFELIQKAAMARIPLVAAVGAPSSLAVDLAQRMNLTLVGYLRNDRFNIYSVPERIALDGET